MKMNINWKTWVGAILAAGSCLSEAVGLGNIDAELLSAGVAMGLWGAGSGIETIDTIKATIMKGWKTWMSLIVIGGSIFLSLTGHDIIAKSILGIGVGLGVIGVTHKAVKVSQKVK